MTLLELSIALAIMSVVIIASGVTVVASMRDRRESSDRYAAINAARDLVSEIQSIANVDTNLGAKVGIGAIFNRYHGYKQSLPGVANGVISVECFGDETSVPIELGGPQDLNFDSDAHDNLTSVGGSSDLKLVPIRVTVSYGESNPRESFTVRRLITRTME